MRCLCSPVKVNYICLHVPQLPDSHTGPPDTIPRPPNTFPGYNGPISFKANNDDLALFFVRT